jgi:large-conductance mechanosensitive channel
MDIISNVGLLKSEYSNFINFLIENNVVSMGLAFIISTQVTAVFNDMMTSIISPIFARIIGSSESKIEDVKLHIFGIEFLIGKFLFSLLHFYIILLILFYIVRLMPMPNKKK